LLGYDTWSLILRDGSKLRVYENRVLRRILGAKWDEVKEGEENCIITSSITCSILI
jgi:hypothetical protein